MFYACCVPFGNALTQTSAASCVVVLLSLYITEGEGDAMASKASSSFSSFQASTQAKADSAATQAKAAVKSALDD